MADDDIAYLRSLNAVRQCADSVGEAAKAEDLNNFIYHEDQMNEVADYVANIIKRDFNPYDYDKIPPFGQWQHFEVSGVPRLRNVLRELDNMNIDKTEQVRRLVDLITVSVVLDFDPADKWRAEEVTTHDGHETTKKHRGRTGLAIAIFHMFMEKLFTSRREEGVPQVDGNGLKGFSTELLTTALNVSKDNPIVGLGSRVMLLKDLGASLLAHPQVFGARGRPGNIVDYILRTARNEGKLDVLFLWTTLQQLLLPIWPNQSNPYGQPLGDAWPLLKLFHYMFPIPEIGANNQSSWIQPFHQQTQWLVYSLLDPFESLLDRKWINKRYLTGLPDTRNGGLFTDFGVLIMKQEQLDRGKEASGQEVPLFKAQDDVIVEWRAMTIVLLDRLKVMVSERLGEGVKLSMAQLQQAGTWPAGKKKAAEIRPQTKSSPILINKEAMVF